jgi:hypothetical protein
MVTSIETQPEYAIRGVVVDRATQRGVRGVKVEAWDRDTRYHDLLGQVLTDEDGRFTIGYDGVFFGDFAPDRSPDVFFKVYLDGRLVLDTFEQTRMNVRPGSMEVRLELDMPQLQPQGRDRITAEQTMKAVDWWRASDFRGVARESGDKVKTVGSLLGGLAGRSLEKFDWEPVRPKGAREKENVNQDLNQAQRAQALQHVEVTEVKTVSGGTRDNLRLLKDYPVALKAGDRVTLYEEGGVVKYYTRVPAVETGQVDGETVARIDGDVQSLKAQIRGVDTLRTEVDNLKSADSTVDQRLAETTATARAGDEEVKRLKRELNEVRQAAASKDAEIVQLRSDLVAVRTATDNLAGRIPLSRLEALELEVRRLRGPTPPGGAAAKKTAARKKTAAAKAPGAGKTAAGKTAARKSGKPKGGR